MSAAITPRWNRYLAATGKTPTPRQAAFLLLPHLEALYGGAAGGGKSVGLLMAALQYVDVPGYAALLLRRTYRDLALPGALMDMSHAWLSALPDDIRPRWSAAEHRWLFPEGGSLSFGYLEAANDRYRYQSAEFQFIGFDELTQFDEADYRYLFSRLRRPKEAEGTPLGRVPLRMRAATNPGGKGHEWVKQRFIIEGRAAGRAFVPARLDDNPHLDREAYERALDELDPVTRAQLRSGDWEARSVGTHFRREWFQVVDAAPVEVAMRVRYWDLAATERQVGRGEDPDWTVGLRASVTNDGVMFIEDVVRVRASPYNVGRLVRQTAVLDTEDVRIAIEREPGAASKMLIDHFRREVLAGWTFYEDRVRGDKVTRAAPLSSYAEAGNVKLVRGSWVGAFLDELEAFPLGAHDDQVDAASGAFKVLVHGRVQHVPTGW